MPPNNPAGQGQAGGGLLPLCKTLLGPQQPEAMAVHLERVVFRVAGEGHADATRTPEDVWRLFKRNRRLPDPLVLACQALAAELPAPPAGCIEPERSLSLCFAAAAYPQTASGMLETELHSRLQAFLGVYLTLGNASAATTCHSDAVVAALRAANRPVLDEDTALDAQLSPTALRGLLLDLTGGERLRRDESLAEQDARACGAALYLCTCTLEHLRSPILERWQSEGAFLDYMRRCLFEPPSCITRQDMEPDRWPSWDSVRDRMKAVYPNEEDVHHDAGIILERMVRRNVREWFPQAEPTLVSQIALDFWQEHHDKLVSGFPYYAFRSRFPCFWKQCLLNHLRALVRTVALNVQVDPEVLERLRRLRELMRQRREARERQRHAPPAVPPPVEPSVVTVTGLTLDELRHYREIFRVIRPNFYPEQKRRPNPTPQQRAADNEAYRRFVVDPVWFHRLEHQITGDGLAARSAKTITDDAKRLAQIQLTENAIYTVCRRLKLRVMACDLARRERLSNMQIRDWKEPKNGKTPFLDEAVILTPASLARIIPLEHTPFWAFTVHLFLYPLIEVQHPDPWNFARYVRELWHWVTEPWFAAAVTQGKKDGSRANDAAAEAATQDLFRTLLEELRGLRSYEELEHHLNTRALHSEEALALATVDRVLGHGWRCTCSPDSIDQLKELCPNAHHWIVPVWYLTVVERLTNEQLFQRLKVDEPDRRTVLGLAEAIHRCLACKQTSVPQDVAHSTTQRRANP